MAAVDDAFLTFLRAYGHTSSLNALDTDTVSEARVNAIFNRHKDTFDSWMKCPNWLKDKYLGKIPYDILAKAAADPNFTEADALKADMEHQKKEDPYSVVPDSLAEHPAYADLCSCGIKFTVAHIAAMKLMTETYARGGYSAENAQKIGSEYAIRKALIDREKAIKADLSLSLEEKDKQLKLLDTQYSLSRPRELEAKKAELKNHPERAVMRLLFDMHQQKLSKEEAIQKMGPEIQKLISSESLVLLAKEMTKPKYQKVIRADEKDLFTDVLIANGVDVADLRKMQQQLMNMSEQKESVQNSSTPQQPQNVSSFIQMQNLRQMKFDR